ncbi:twin-arginine translocation signal domain-containing protein [Antarctobacter heliothermus]|uniref:Tat (Twin-arginine translocation) pathway signal sequence n=1 Tax=Antarctobacter heliothermus TaxID=74033 RepID=A0A239I0Y6_9RHOB|nr:twin-arginine translocation signal domain-containing protein [Antarctobacter heliothermus]SNS87121.1 Tat (twin-arginine translocation) pathway signal sequence [Antarctobacter heliothermus]
MSIRNQTLTRRQLLSQSAMMGTSFAIGASFVAGQAEAANWALEVEHLKPETMATLIQMARDIYPHDQVSDEFYAIAVKGYDSADTAEATEAGIATLNAAAQGIGFATYIDVGWERDRVDLLRGMENSAFFQQIRGGLVTGLYNQKAVWPIFGYEGESYSQGGYMYRGFDDINWL